MECCDVAVIGAGILGCFAARALSAYRLRCVVLEAREDVCTGITRANTGIVYTGADTRPGTLKTRLCVRANRNFGQLCSELDVTYDPCGSIMLAFGPRAERVLKQKLDNAEKNGVSDGRLLSSAEVLAMEPAVAPSVTAGLYLPHTGTVIPWELGIAAFENARHNGAEFRFHAEVKHLRREGAEFVVETERESLRARCVINCAGMCSDAVRELCEKPSVRIAPDGGDYLVLDQGAEPTVRHIIFHEPEEKGKGLTLVPTTDGNVLIGPTERDRAHTDYATDREGINLLRRMCGEIVPALPLERCIRGFGAVRPNPYDVSRPERSIHSFCVLEERGLISLVGIKTPGLTCAAELGRYVCEMALNRLGVSEKKREYDPHRRRIEKPGTGPVLCRCRGVTEGEIIEAIRRGACTVNGVKRRTGAGMGRCQGAYCMPRVMELLARELPCAPEEISLDGVGTEILGGTCHGTM